MQLSLFDTVSNVINTLGSLTGFNKNAVDRTARPRVIAPPAPKKANDPSKRSVQCSQSFVLYTLKRGKRKTIGFLVDDLGLSISAPKWVTITQIESAIRERELWIAKKTVEWRQHVEKREKLKIHWQANTPIPLMGENLVIRLSNSADVSKLGVLRVGNELLVALPENASDEQIKNRVQSWLQLQAKKVFAERIPIYSQKLGAAPSRWRLSSARTRWGSCAHDGSVRLNWRLIHFPLDIIDYVIAHELAHLKELNHGPEFWRTVGELFPDYEQKRNWLKRIPADS